MNCEPIIEIYFMTNLSTLRVPKKKFKVLFSGKAEKNNKTNNVITKTGPKFNSKYLIFIYKYKLNHRIKITFPKNFTNFMQLTFEMKPKTEKFKSNSFKERLTNTKRQSVEADQQS